MATAVGTTSADGVSATKIRPSESVYKRTGHPSSKVAPDRSDQSVLLKWNARVLRTGSGQNDPAHGSKRGNLENCGGKMYARTLGPFRLNWLEPVFFYGRPERADGKRP